MEKVTPYLIHYVPPPIPHPEDLAFQKLESARSDLKKFFDSSADDANLFESYSAIKDPTPEIEEKFEAYKAALQDYQSFFSIETARSTEATLYSIDPSLVGKERYQLTDRLITRIAKKILYTISRWVVGDKGISRLDNRLSVLKSGEITSYRNSSYTDTQNRLVEGRDAANTPLRNKGSYGSLTYRDREGGKIGIFKAVDGGFSIGKIIKCFIANLLSIRDQEGYLPLPQNRHRASMLAERVSYLLDKEIETNSNPQTEILKINGSQGSFQHFLNGYKEAEEVKFPSNPNTDDLDKFQRFAILDFLSGNLDRKEDNWMVKLKEDDHIEDIKGIDNANSFPRGHLPEGSSFLGVPLSYDEESERVDFAQSKQYKWKELSLANAPLTEKSKELIRSLTDEKIQNVVKAWKEDLGVEDFNAFFGGEEGEVIKAFKDRVKVLHKFLENHENDPFAKLGDYKSYSKIQECLGEKPQASLATYQGVI